MADVAKGLARTGYEVVVYTSERGYENPSLRYTRREFIPVGDGHGVDVRRIPFASLGKSNLPIRVLAAASFQLQVLWHQLTTPRLAGIFFSTSPPLVGVTACVARIVRGIPIAYWAMDLNPDQLIAMGKTKETSLVARFLEAANRFVLRRSSLIIALDRFMRDRLVTRGDFADKTLLLPPWPHEEAIEDVEESKNPFRERHGLVGKYVVMYSGNHSPANPLATLLQAAVAFKDDDRVRFVFVGGGLGKQEVEACIREHDLKNMLSLPYQPLADLRYSLSAADVHVVSMGHEMVGIIHPCKIYGAMAVGRPVLYLGPIPSHVSDILEAHRFGWQVAHGDVQEMRRRIEAILATPKAELRRLGQEARSVLSASYSQDLLLGRMVHRLEQTFGPAAASAGPSPKSGIAT